VPSAGLHGRRRAKPSPPATNMISAIDEAKATPDAERAFAVSFSGEAFEGYDVRLAWQQPNPSGSGN